MIPAAARADSQYLGGAEARRIEAKVDGEDEHSSPTLGHSEPLGVQNPEGPPIPELPQATEERPKVAAGMGAEESRHVLQEDGGRSVPLHKVEEGVGESTPGVGAVGVGSHPGSLPGDRQILTREAAGPE
jgi:hypothetical protein